MGSDLDQSERDGRTVDARSLDGDGRSMSDGTARVLPLALRPRHSGVRTGQLGHAMRDFGRLLALAHTERWAVGTAPRGAVRPPIDYWQWELRQRPEPAVVEPAPEPAPTRRPSTGDPKLDLLLALRDARKQAADAPPPPPNRQPVRTTAHAPRRGLPRATDRRRVNPFTNPTPQPTPGAPRTPGHRATVVAAPGGLSEALRPQPVNPAAIDRSTSQRAPRTARSQEPTSANSAGPVPSRAPHAGTTPTPTQGAWAPTIRRRTRQVPGATTTTTTVTATTAAAAAATAAAAAATATATAATATATAAPPASPVASTRTTDTATRTPDAAARTPSGTTHSPDNPKPTVGRPTPRASEPGGGHPQREPAPTTVPRAPAEPVLHETPAATAPPAPPITPDEVAVARRAVPEFDTNTHAARARRLRLIRGEAEAPVDARPTTVTQVNAARPAPTTSPAPSRSATSAHPPASVHTPVAPPHAPSTSTGTPSTPTDARSTPADTRSARSLTPPAPAGAPPETAHAGPRTSALHRSSEVHHEPADRAIAPPTARAPQTIPTVDRPRAEVAPHARSRRSAPSTPTDIPTDMTEVPGNGTPAASTTSALGRRATPTAVSPPEHGADSTVTPSLLSPGSTVTTRTPAPPLTARQPTERPRPAPSGLRSPAPGEQSVGETTRSAVTGGRVTPGRVVRPTPIATRRPAAVTRSTPSIGGHPAPAQPVATRSPSAAHLAATASPGTPQWSRHRDHGNHGSTTSTSPESASQTSVLGPSAVEASSVRASTISSPGMPATPAAAPDDPRNVTPNAPSARGSVTSADQLTPAPPATGFASATHPRAASPGIEPRLAPQRSATMPVATMRPLLATNGPRTPARQRRAAAAASSTSPAATATSHGDAPAAPNDPNPRSMAAQLAALIDRSPALPRPEAGTSVPGSTARSATSSAATARSTAGAARGTWDADDLVRHLGEPRVDPGTALRGPRQLGTPSRASTARSAAPIAAYQRAAARGATAPTSSPAAANTWSSRQGFSASPRSTLGGSAGAPSPATRAAAAAPAARPAASVVRRSPAGTPRATIRRAPRGRAAKRTNGSALIAKTPEATAPVERPFGFADRDALLDWLVDALRDRADRETERRGGRHWGMY